MEETQDKLINEIDNEPEKFLPTFNPFDTILYLLAAYGWWILAISTLLYWAYNKSRPTLEKWKIQKEDAEYHKNPDIVLKRLEAIEAARSKQQHILEASAREYQQREQEKAEKKRQEFIDKNTGKNAGNKLGSKTDYFPLCGPGTSGGYKPPKKSKCPGGGCGR
ncbi:selenoprotein S-like [Arctopsyche grandis]|uniref:selenoprotein S-like n=1 Tax=Arctopsyche grandis TaxID=121162 RepID=UPI00406DA41F